MIWMKFILLALSNHHSPHTVWLTFSDQQEKYFQEQHHIWLSDEEHKKICRWQRGYLEA